MVVQVFSLSSLPSQGLALAEALAFPAVALVFCFGWLSPSHARGELLQGCNLPESPAAAQISSWVWLKTLQQCGKGPLLFPEPLFQLRWVSLARGTLQKQGSGCAGGGRQEHQRWYRWGKPF